MNTHADKTQKSKSQSISATDSQMQSSGESTFRFVDNRPEAIAQRKLQEMANNSSHVSQFKAFQDIVNNSPKTEQTAQLQAMADKYSALQQQPIQRKENNTGLPDNLKTGMENLSGRSLDDVKVHRNSDKPAQLHAHAYAQGTDIHLGPGQEKHLPHELGHVVQQKEGRVKPTKQLKGKVAVNDDAGLEKEADVMGKRAILQQKSKSHDKGCSCSNCTTQLKSHDKGCSCSNCTTQLKRHDKRSSIGNINDKITQRVVHENAETTSLRLDLPEGFVHGGATIDHLANSATELKKIPSTLNVTQDKNEFIKEYAKYLSIQEHQDETHAEELIGAAKSRLEDAKCRAFTNQKSQTWYLGDGQPSDVIHEMVHILSAKGGMNKLIEDFGTSINEGFTHYFTIQICGRMNVPVTPAYPEDTALATKFVHKFGESAIYNAYFKGSTQALYEIMQLSYNGYLLSGKLADGTNPKFSEKSLTGSENRDERIKSLKSFCLNKKFTDLEKRIF